MKPFKDVNKVWYGNTETGEIIEVEINETHEIRGGIEYITEKGNFLATEKASHYFMGKDIFSTDKQDVVRTMDDYVWGMSDEAILNFQNHKKAQ